MTSGMWVTQRGLHIVTLSPPPGGGVLRGCLLLQEASLPFPLNSDLQPEVTKWLLFPGQKAKADRRLEVTHHKSRMGGGDGTTAGGLCPGLLSLLATLLCGPKPGCLASGQFSSEKSLWF